MHGAEEDAGLRAGRLIPGVLQLFHIDPYVLLVVEIAPHGGPVPVILQVLRLHGNAHRGGAEYRYAFAARATNAWVVHARASDVAQCNRERLAGCVVDRIEQTSSVGNIKLLDVVQFGIDSDRKSVV